MFRCIDDFLIDRTFQPASDALARWVSCYGIAEFLWTGAMLARLVMLVHETDRDWIATLIVIPLMLVFLLECRREDIKPPSAILPVFRVKHFRMRCAWIILVPIEAFLLAAGENWSDRLQSLSWFAVYAACWFMACRRNPPKPARAPAMATGALSQ
jgi:hypothetical protein